MKFGLRFEIQGESYGRGTDFVKSLFSNVVTVASLLQWWQAELPNLICTLSRQHDAINMPIICQQYQLTFCEKSEPERRSDVSFFPADRAVFAQPGAELVELPRLPAQDGLLVGCLVRLQPVGVEQALVRLRPQQEDRHVLRRQAGGQGQGRHLLPGKR